MRAYRFTIALALLFILCVGTAVSAQDDTVTQASYDREYSHRFFDNGERWTLEFEAEAGDVVYGAADFEEFDLDSELDLTLLDAEGRRVGEDIEYEFFYNIVFAQIPEAGTYNLTIDYTASQNQSRTVLAYIGETRMIGVQPYEFTVRDEGFIHFAGIEVPESGRYELTFTVATNRYYPSIDVTDYSGTFETTLMSLYGTDFSELSITLELMRNRTYIISIGESLGVYQRYGSGARADIALALKPVD